MSELENDPIYRTGYNAALEWAAQWLEHSAMTGYSAETIETLNANATTIRAVKLPIEQQNFADAVRNDPYMTPERKAFWLSLCEKGGEG